jgi:mRNA interferase MazF
MAGCAVLEQEVSRGDVWLLDLGGTAGRRPALILTRQAVIPHVNKLTVAEITSAMKGYPTEVPIGQKATLTKESFVQLDNIQTVPKTRFVKYVGALDEQTMRRVGRKAVLALGLEEAL